MAGELSVGALSLPLSRDAWVGLLRARDARQPVVYLDLDPKVHQWGLSWPDHDFQQERLRWQLVMNTYSVQPERTDRNLVA